MPLNKIKALVGDEIVDLSEGFKGNIGVSGYQVLSSGFIIQWAVWSKPAGSSAPTSITWPIAFPNTIVGAWTGVSNGVFPTNIQTTVTGAVLNSWFNTANVGAGTVFSIGR